jgi:hypothetical protein
MATATTACGLHRLSGHAGADKQDREEPEDHGSSQGLCR